MERPEQNDMIRPVSGERLVARTQSIEEANKVSEQYEMQGYHSRIAKKSQGHLSIYEVWISKKPDAIQRM